MSRCNSSFWLTSMGDLFCSLQILPTTHMTTEQKFNALTRLVLILFLIVWCVDFRLALIFLFLSLIIIIILYYLQRTPMSNTQENFTNSYNLEYVQTPQSMLPPENFKNRQPEPVEEFVLYSPQQNAFCNNGQSQNAFPECVVPKDDSQAELDQYIQYNDLLRDDPVTIKNRPKFVDILYQPAIFSTEAWAQNDFTYLPGINRESLYDHAASGYAFDKDKEGFITCKMDCDKEVKEGFKFIPTESYHPKFNQSYQEIKNNKPPNDCEEIKKGLPTNIDTTMGYYPKQMEEYNLPVNLDMGPESKQDAYKAYNKNMFTSSIQPSVITNSEIIDPSAFSANMGISYTQPLATVSHEMNPNGQLQYTVLDPNLKKQLKENYSTKRDDMNKAPNKFNVFDPRFSGYGTQYRSYLDPLTGQPRFFYDDVNAVKLNTYVTRNNVDFTNYGPGMSEYGEMNGGTMRKKVTDTFTYNTIARRTDLQERLMRKNNMVAWQNKMYPKYTY